MRFEPNFFIFWRMSCTLPSLLTNTHSVHSFSRAGISLKLLMSMSFSPVQNSLFFVI